jgi:hypothetical protein
VTDARRGLLPLLLLVLVSSSLFAFDQVHAPDYTFGLLGQEYAAATRLKARLATVALMLAGVQLVLALWIYNRLPGAGTAPRWAHVTHRLNGALTIAVTLPIAVHCLLAYGVQLDSPRLAVHSVAGCLFYGVFAAKVCLVRDRRQPARLLPLAGTLLLGLIALLWYSAALWVFNGYQVPFLR